MRTTYLTQSESENLIANYCLDRPSMSAAELARTPIEVDSIPGTGKITVRENDGYREFMAQDALDEIIYFTPILSRVLARCEDSLEEIDLMQIRQRVLEKELCSWADGERWYERASHVPYPDRENTIEQVEYFISDEYSRVVGDGSDDGIDELVEQATYVVNGCVEENESWISLLEGWICELTQLEEDYISDTC